MNVVVIFEICAVLCWVKFIASIHRKRSLTLNIDQPVVRMGVFVCVSISVPSLARCRAVFIVVGVGVLSLVIQYAIMSYIPQPYNSF